MLYLEKTPGEFVQWHGERIAGIAHPKTIEKTWDDAALAEIGLYRPQPADPEPAGHRAIGTTVERVGDVVKFIRQTEPIPVEDRQATQKKRIAKERERRMALPVTVNLQDGRSFPVQTDPKSREIIAGLAQVGTIRLVTQSTETSTFRDMDNVDQAMSPAELVSMGVQVAASVDAIYKASWAIKSRPDYLDLEDLTNDTLWA